MFIRHYILILILFLQKKNIFLNTIYKSNPRLYSGRFWYCCCCVQSQNARIIRNNSLRWRPLAQQYLLRQTTRPILHYPLARRLLYFFAAIAQSTTRMPGIPSRHSPLCPNVCRILAVGKIPRNRRKKLANTHSAKSHHNRQILLHVEEMSELC